jgi:glycosyltransferase involved in cell wall biosynthesis
MGRKRRILVVSHSCANPVNQQIYRELQKQTAWGFSMLLPKVWRDEFGNLVRPSPLEDFDVQLIETEVWLNGNIILHGYRRDLRRLLQEREFDLIYMNHEPYAVATAQICWANLGSRRTPFGFYSCQNLEKSYPAPFCWTERMVYRSSAFAFPITAAVAQVLRRKGFKGDLAICPLPFDPELYRKRPDIERTGAIPRKNGEAVVGYVGRIVEQKGLATLVEALAKLPRSDWKLTVIGTGPFEATFDEMVRQKGLEGRVVRLGYVPHAQTPSLLAAMDILVLPSETRPNWKEQFGRVIVEALACGVPVIGSDSGEIPTLIKASGGGLIFPEGDAASLAKALEQMIADGTKRRAYASAGSAWAVKNISLSAVAATMGTCIEATIAKFTSNRL